jgi:hypothetical protein
LITGNSVLLGTVKFDRSADTLKKASAIWVPLGLNAKKGRRTR